jgi:hypothetical protein
MLKSHGSVVQEFSMLSDEDFLVLLEELRVLLGESEVERYNYFIQNSVEGRSCVFAQKSLIVFRDRAQRKPLIDKIEQIYTTVREPNGEDYRPS